MKGRFVAWLAAPLLGMLVYWPGFTSWFTKDDFAWLGLHRMMQTGTGPVEILFHPYAQGTIRTISERIPYTAFVALFGLSSVPFRVLEFLTMIAVAMMIAELCAELTGSRRAGVLAAILWTVNNAVSVAVFWSAVYNQLLCSLVFLSALRLLVRYNATGERRYFIAQWIVYLLGFGVLEQNVVYPALAAAYSLCCAPRLLRKVLPMFVPAIAYSALHLAAAPLAREGVYKMHWDLSVFPTLWTYFKIALGPIRLSNIGIFASRPRSLAAAVLIVAVLGYLAVQLFRRDRISVLFAAWFVIVLAPLLPLKDHVTDYYLAIPVIGLAMLAAQGLSAAWTCGSLGRTAAIILLATYLVPNFMIGRAKALSFHRAGDRNRKILQSVALEARAQGATQIVLSGVAPEIQDSLFRHSPLRLYGFDQVVIVGEKPAAAATPGTFVADLSAYR